MKNKMCSLLKNNEKFLKKVSILIIQVHKINTSTYIRRESDAANKNHSKIENAPRSVAQLYKCWTKKFTKAGISEPKESIQYILAHVFNLNKITDLYCKIFSNIVDVQTQNQIELLCKKRLTRMPIQYILGEWQFRDLILKMKSPVFIPRPETEMLIDLILDDLRQIKGKIKILEICCGSGAISLALLKHNTNIEITAIDKNIEACSLTKENAVLHKLFDRIKIKNYKINEINRLQDVADKFDVIVSNPPYVPTKDVESVQPEIKFFEDLEALDGGPDGLDTIKIILLIAQEKLVDDGILYLETDSSHPSKISQIIQNDPKSKLRYIKCYTDFYNKERFVKIKKVK